MVVVVFVLLQIRPEDPVNIPFVFSAFEVNHAPHSVCENDDAPANILSMFFTLDTSHLEMSLLNDLAE